MNKLLATLSFYLMVSFSAECQTLINKSINVAHQSSLKIKTLHTDVIVKTWDKNEILIDGYVSIDEGASDDVFDLDIKEKSNYISIETSMNLQSLKKKNTYISSNNYNKDCSVKYSNGHMIKSELTITIPKSITLDIAATYGSVKVEDLSQNTSIENTYGSIDAIVENMENIENLMLHSVYSTVDLTISPRIKADMELITDFGQIYTDIEMDIKTNKSMKRNFMGDKIKSSLNGGGNKIKLESNYSNVYVRQS